MCKPLDALSVVSLHWLSWCVTCKQTGSLLVRLRKLLAKTKTEVFEQLSSEKERAAAFFLHVHHKPAHIFEALGAQLLVLETIVVIFSKNMPCTSPWFTFCLGHPGGC